jgi:hypothetical protein
MNNIVTLTGGNFSGAKDVSIIGGKAKNGSATGNIVTIGGNVTSLANAIVQGGSSDSGDAFTGNILHKESDAAIKEVSNFETVNFGYTGDAGIAKLDTTVRGASESSLVKLNTQSHDITFNGTITGTNGGIEKQGDGNLTLTGINTGIKKLIVETGRVTLVGSHVSGISGGGVLGNGGGDDEVVVNERGTFELWGNAQVNGTIQLNNTLHTLIVRTYGEREQVVGAKVSKLDINNSRLLFIIDSDPIYYTADNPVLKITGSGSTFDGKNTVEISSPNYLLRDFDMKKSLVGGEAAHTAFFFEGIDSGDIAYGSITDMLYSYKVSAEGELETKGSLPETKTLSEGFLGGLGLVSSGGDLVMDKGISSAVASAGGGAGQSFAALGGGKIKYKTGSSVDVSGTSLVAGMATVVGAGATLGGFVEYGDGDYDSYNSFASGKVKGSGDTDYYGVGVLGRIDLSKTTTGQPYLEGTVRFGQVKNDYRTSVQGYRTKYDVKSSYYGVSLGGGHVWSLSKDNTVDLYGRYVWTRQAADKTRLSGLPGTAQEIKFSAVDSQRVRVGARYTTAWSGDNRFYMGAAWEHEFDGKADVKIGGMKVDEAPDLKGNTGIAEFGLVLTPTGNKNLTVDLGIQAYGGKHKGATGSAQLKYVF